MLLLQSETNIPADIFALKIHTDIDDTNFLFNSFPQLMV